MSKTFQKPFKIMCPTLALSTMQNSPSEIGVLLELALQNGIRHIVCAHHVESEVGKIISSWLLSGRILRQELFISVQLPPQGLRRSDVRRYLLHTLLNLGLNYVDSYLISSPVGFQESLSYDLTVARDYLDQVVVDMNTNLLDVWKGMERVRDEGLTLAIGVSNFNKMQLERIYEQASVKPSYIEIEFHPFLQQKSIVDYCQSHNIVVTAVLPHVFTDHSTVGFQNPLAENELLAFISSNLKRTPEQVIIKWIIQRNCVAVSENLSTLHILKCLKIFDFDLSEEQMKSINGLDRNERIINRSFLISMESHPEYPFNL